MERSGGGIVDGYKKCRKKIGGKAGDKVAQLSSLSPAQVENVQLLREKYLLEMPNPNDPTAREQTERLMAASSVEIFNAYLPQIKDLYLPIKNEAEYGKEFDDAHNIRYINITKWVTDKKENNLEKLVNVYAVLSNEDCNIALVFERKQNKTNVYLAIVNNKNSTSSTDADNYKDQIVEAIRGNFPGAEWKDSGLGVLPCFKDDKNYSVATASNIPTEKSEKFISQTIEKLIDGIIPDTNKKEYTIILLATPILDVEDRKLKLGEFYSGLAPYASWSTSFQRTENESKSSSATVGVNVGASAGVQNGVNSSITDTQGTTDSTSRTDTESESDTETENESLTENESEADSKGTSETDTDTKGSSDNVGGFASGTLVAGGGIMPASASATVGASYNHGWNRSTAKALGKTAQKTITKGLAKTVGKSTGRTVGTAVANTLGRAVTSSMAATRGVSKAVSFPVLECVEFGRNVVTYDEVRQDAPEIGLGNVFHMNHTENTKVSLSKKSLASHTFITGSTGSGKSNTVYHMLDRARKQGVKFLVVEPAKGEYKNVFGGRKDVTVLGTNPKLSQLLRINPFSFPENIHVLEHMDRLVEIFNVCWPMYAAMPAVLKNAVEKSYVDCGWDIVKSENKYGEELYPSFADVARNVKEIIDSSEYDAENKGAYKGSLLTRLQSLCNGINGMIFVADEIPKEQLFEENVIVDLSRVGSSETKSLIMGMMVLKLQEYRMSSATGMNAELNHITVLEEAHNLLRRTSNEQSAEGSNLLGKSVEMLSNAIAEMRTYGEGFIIADQAPGLMDMSVIRNTNTKIILRLPDQADRELVGRAANLNEDQITELAKLPCGVAAVYQNEWIQPVLCKVDLFAAPEKPFMFDPDDNDSDNYCKTEVEESLLNCIMEKEILRRGNKTDLKALKSKIIKSKLETCVKRDFMEYLEHDGENAIETLRKLIYDFLSAENAIIEAKQCNDIVEWTRTVVDRLNPSLRAYPNKQIDLALALILYEQTLRDASYGSVFCKFTEVYKNEGGVF